MAVSQLILSGSIASGSVLIQPASGTIYSLKRGLISSNASGGKCSIAVGGVGVWPITGLSTNEFFSYSFSEAGLIVHGSPTTSPYTAPSSSLFSAISNSSGHYIVRQTSGTVQYSLVGVSLT